MITLQDVKNNKEIEAFIKSGQKQLDALGYTEHSTRHINIVSKRAGDLLEVLGYPKERIELARIAGYMHDIGNCINNPPNDIRLTNTIISINTIILSFCSNFILIFHLSFYNNLVSLIINSNQIFKNFAACLLIIVLSINISK